MKDRNLPLFIRVLLFIAISTPVLSAQVAGSGFISGVVSSGGGSALAGVAVKAWVSEASSLAASVSDAAGTYRLVLPPGIYTVTFSAPGFKTAAVSNVSVAGEGAVSLGVKLTPGGPSETVAVEWLPPIEAGVNEAQENAAQVKDVPLSSRNYTQAAGLASGVSSQVSNATSLGMNSQGVKVGSSVANNYMIDGVSIAASTSAADSPAALNPDAIAANSVQSWSYSAGPERYAGANISVTTRSGAGALHGSLFESVRNDLFNANDFFLKRQGIGEPVLKQNQFGFSVGGPLLKDKASFFFAYQGTRQSNGFASAGFAPKVTLPPLPAARTAASVGAALCPSGHPGDSRYATLRGGVQVACDGSNINPVAINLLNLKLPNGNFAIPGSGTGGFRTASFTMPAAFREDQVLLNTDYALTEKQKLSERFFYGYDPQTANFTGGPSTLPGFRYSISSANIYGLIRLNSAFSSTLQNELRVSGQHDLQKHSPQIPFTNNDVGITSILPGIDAIDTINISGLFSLGGANVRDYISVNQYQIGDQISWTQGKHALRLGFEVDRRQWNMAVTAYARGSLSIGSFADLLLGLPGCPPGSASCNAANPMVNGAMTNGTPYSNIYGSLGSVSSAYVTSVSGIQHSFRFSDASGYLQDSIHLLDRLTIEAGLRWDYFGLLADATGNNTNFWPSLAHAWTVPGSSGTYEGFVVPSNFKGSLAAGVVRNSRNTPIPGGAPLWNIAPRLGFSLQTFKKRSLILRGGYGIFYDRLDTWTLVQQPMADVPYAVPVGGTGTANYAASLAHPYPQAVLGWGAARAANFITGASSNLSLSTIDENLSVPITQKWNFEIEQQLPFGFIVVAGYAGAHSVHLQSASRQINVPELADSGHPVNGLTVSNVTNAALRVPYLGIAANGLSSAQTQGSAKFNSLQVAVSKRTANGLHAQAAYMFSKNLTVLGAAPNLPGQPNFLADSGMNSNNPLDARQQYGPSENNAPHRLAVRYGWDFPWKVSGMAGKLVNRWGFSGATVIQSGTPLTLSDNLGGTIYGGAGISRAQFCPGKTARDLPTTGSLHDRIKGYFNLSAIADTTVTFGSSTCALPKIGDGTGFGNAGVGIILGPGQNNTDIALSKSGNIKAAKIELRVEFFNAFNHAQFMWPDTSVTNGTFGVINSTSVNPRLVQFGLKASF